MKNTMNLKLFLPLVLAFAGGAGHAAALTRAVKVVEGSETKLYLGTQYGQTLYTFDLDSNGSSQCNAACAEKWPPILVSEKEAQALVAPYASVKRASGLLQVTYQNRPIYTFFLDHAEGDDKGDGVGGVWHDIDFK